MNVSLFNSSLSLIYEICLYKYLIVSYTIVVDVTTVGTPIAITGTPKYFCDISFRLSYIEKTL